MSPLAKLLEAALFASPRPIPIEELSALIRKHPPVPLDDLQHNLAVSREKLPWKPEEFLATKWLEAAAAGVAPAHEPGRVTAAHDEGGAPDARRRWLQQARRVAVEVDSIERQIARVVTRMRYLGTVIDRILGIPEGSIGPTRARCPTPTRCCRLTSTR